MKAEYGWFSPFTIVIDEHNLQYICQWCKQVISKRVFVTGSGSYWHHECAKEYIDQLNSKAQDIDNNDLTAK